MSEDRHVDAVTVAGGVLAVGATAAVGLVLGAAMGRVGFAFVERYGPIGVAVGGLLLAAAIALAEIGYRARRAETP